MKVRSLADAAIVAGLLSMTGVTAHAQTCRDPWITQAIREVTGRAPNGNNESGECTYIQYGGGRWSSYPELKDNVQARLKPPTMPMNQMTGGTPAARAPVKVPAAAFARLPKRTENGRPQVYYQNRWWNTLIDSDGATLIGSDGAT